MSDVFVDLTGVRSIFDQPTISLSHILRIYMYILTQRYRETSADGHNQSWTITEAMKALNVIPYLLLVGLSAYYVCDMYLNNEQSEGLYGHTFEKSECIRKIKNVTLPKHYESLFYRADMKPAIRNAVRGVCTFHFIYL